ncbi:MAG: penicillin-binding protein [Gaiellales bacterium]|jgi:peptidoglycan glycosyltransferase|nr:penicillin-binding protein [Gaiellales bacterium]
MNPRIGGLFKMAAIGVAVLVTMTAYWQIWAAGELAAREDNARLVYRELQIRRGLIYASDGKTVIAGNIKRRRNGLDVFLRRYPFGSLFGHPVGYNTIGQGRTELELSENDYLTASNADLSTVFDRIGEKLQGQTVTGNNLITSLSLPAQRAAMEGLAGHRGAVVAIEPSTGRILAMASSPGYNPNTVARNFGSLGRTSRGSPLLNRGTQGLYAPGSTFKVVTTTAALESRKFTPDSLIDGKGRCITVQTVPLCNAGSESAGVVSLSEALTFSYNTVFAQIGQQVGQRRLYETMEKYGFFDLPPLDYPSDEMTPSGLYSGGGLLARNAPIDIGRVAIGQERLLSTPMQMATVAATIANSGVRMRPTLVDRAISPSGEPVFTTRPEQVNRVMSPANAHALRDMMRRVVEEGTGTAANVLGLNVAGKTGTAETGASGLNTAWFIAFAPADDPKIAIAAVIEQTPDFGGTVAAPIAARVIEAYLGASVAK